MERKRRKRWTLRVADSLGQTNLLVIEVPADGTVRASLGSTAITLEPERVSRLIELYRAAQLEAIEVRGRW
jgi:phage terminase large subunit-like protein